MPRLKLIAFIISTSLSSIVNASEPKTFLAEKLGDIAHEFRVQLLRDARPAAAQYSQAAANNIQQSANRDRQSAEKALVGYAARDPRDPRVWELLARLYEMDLDAASKQTLERVKSEHADDGSNDDVKEQQILSEAGKSLTPKIRNLIGAAYSSYLYSEERKSQAESLAALSNALGGAAKLQLDLSVFRADGGGEASPDELGRLALRSAGLSDKFNSTEKSKRLVADFNQDWGYKLASDPKILSDLKDPRVCFDFTPDLIQVQLPDPSRFVTVEPGVADLSVRIVPAEGERGDRLKGDNLCVDGLSRHIQYQITLKQGLPFQDGGTLLRDISKSVRVEDRSPSVHFVGRTYIVPRKGPNKIPLVSYGLNRVYLSLYRVGDRALPPVVAVHCASEFVQNLGGDTCQSDVLSTFGRKVWPSEHANAGGSVRPSEGSFDVEQSGDVNTDVLSSIPLGDMIPNRTPGIYVLFAKTGLENDDAGDSNNLARQWFVVTDIGLTSISGPDGLHVYTRSLATAQKLSNIEVRLIALDNEVLATRRTDDGGGAIFERPLLNGTGGAAAVILVASDEANGDYSFLDLNQASFDLTDRGVEGREAPKDYDAYVDLGRGVYRPGESVSAIVLLRDGNGNAVPKIPLSVTVLRPDRTEYHGLETKSEDGGAGGRVVRFDLPPDAQRGTWHFLVRVDPNLPEIVSKEFLVDNYVPDQLDFKVQSSSPMARSGTPLPIEIVDGRFLYDAPAADLQVEGKVKIERSNVFSDSPAGYEFGLDDEEFAATTEYIDGLPRTDASGSARFSFPFPQAPETSAPLQATMTLGLRLPGGRAVRRTLVKPIAPRAAMIGIKPNFGGHHVEDNSTAAFEVILFDQEGKRIGKKGLHWVLKQVSRDFQWYKDENDLSLSFEPFTREKTISSGSFDADSSHPSTIQISVATGRYRLDVGTEANSEPTTSVSFEAGWAVGKVEETPETLELALDKPSYHVGDIAKVRINPRFNGRALLTVYSNKLVAQREVQITADQATTVELPVEPGWGTGAYLLGFAYRQVDNSTPRLRARAIGATWVGIDPSQRRLNVALDTPQIRSNSTYTLSARVTELAPGEKAFAVMTVADVGVLNLTSQSAPDPLGWLFAQRRLSADIHDLYGFVVDGTEGTVRQLREGGDNGGLPEDVPVPVKAPVSFVSGISPVRDDGSVEFTGAIPLFQGTLRVNVIVWSQSQLGAGSVERVVQDPLVMTAVTPRFMVTGDSAQAVVDLYNAQLPAGAFDLVSQTDGPVSVPPEASKLSALLNVHERKTLVIPLSARGVGLGKLTLTPDGGVSAAQSFSIPVEPSRPLVTKFAAMQISPGQALHLDAKTLSEFQVDDSRVEVSASKLLALNLPALTQAIDEDSDASSELAATRGFALVVARQLDADRTPKGMREIQSIVKELLDRQRDDGGFRRWGPTSIEDTETLESGGFNIDAYVTDFLLRADDIGVTVEPQRIERALENLWNGAQSTPTPYSLYVLARSKPYVARHPKLAARNYPIAALPLLRKMAEEALGLGTQGDAPAAGMPDNTSATGTPGDAPDSGPSSEAEGGNGDDAVNSPYGKAKIAAGLAILEDKDLAHTLFVDAVHSISEADKGVDGSQGSEIEFLDRIALFTLLTVYGDQQLAASLAPKELVAHLDPTTLGIEEVAWSALAAGALDRYDQDLKVEINSNVSLGAFRRTFTGTDLSKEPIEIKNTTTQPIFVSIEKTGRPISEIRSASAGLTLVRKYFGMNGKPIDVRQIKQFDRIIVDLTATWPKNLDLVGPIKLVDELPAGFEADPIADREEESANLAILGKLTKPLSFQTLDTRYISLIAAPDEDADRVIHVGYVLRAVMPGRYKARPAAVVDMNKPAVFARTASDQLTVLPSSQ